MDQQYSFHFLDHSLPIPHTDDFIESEINADALKWIEAWPDQFLSQNSVMHIAFPHAMMICAPEGCGKTHLANQWAKRFNATFLTCADIKAILNNPPHTTHYYVVEDIHLIQDESLLFHFFNIIKDMESYVLFTSLHPPSLLPISLPDLRSRFNAIPVIRIPEPDDELLFHITCKFFHERQLKVEADVIHYMLCRINRSIRAVKDTVSKLDASSLIERRAITIPFVKDILSRENMSATTPQILWAPSN